MSRPAPHALKLLALLLLGLLANRTSLADKTNLQKLTSFYRLVE